MKFKKCLFLILGVAALLLAAAPVQAQTNALSSDLPLPAALQAQLPAGAAAFNPAGLSFTNVSVKVAAGTQIESGTGGTLSYFQADYDAFKVGAFDIGFGAETTLSSLNSGFHSTSADLELIKNFPNWQLVGKLGYGRNWDDNVGNYAEFGFDVNYNLTAGAGLSWLGTKGGSFAYVGTGVDWADKNLSLTAAQSDIVKSWRIYVGYAF